MPTAKNSRLRQNQLLLKEVLQVLEIERSTANCIPKVHPPKRDELLTVQKRTVFLSPSTTLLAAGLAVSAARNSSWLEGAARPGREVAPAPQPVQGGCCGDGYGSRSALLGVRKWVSVETLSQMGRGVTELHQKSCRTSEGLLRNHSFPPPA